MRVLFLILILTIHTGAEAQARRNAPSVLPYHTNYNQFSPFLGNRTLPGAQNTGGNSMFRGSPPPTAPYMGAPPRQFGQQFGSAGQFGNSRQFGMPQRRFPNPYQSPFDNYYGQQSQSGLGSIISMIASLFGGGNNGGFGGLSNLFGNRNSSNTFQGGPNDVSPTTDFPAGNPPGQVAPDVLPPSDMAGEPDFLPGTPPLTQAPPVAPPIATTGAPDFPAGNPPPDVLPADMGRTDPPPPATLVPRNPRDGAVVTRPDSLTPDETRRIQQQHRVNLGAQRTPIWGPFYARFKQCRPDCEPIGYSVHRSRSRNGRPSCHHSDRAIDMFGMACRDGVHMAINSTKTSGPIAILTNCMMANKRPAPGKNLRVHEGLGCLWHNGPDIRLGHQNHVHFSIGCGGGW